MVAFKSALSCDDLLTKKSILSAWHWRFILIVGDTVIVLFTILYTLLLSVHGREIVSIVGDAISNDVFVVLCWFAAGILAWGGGVHIARPYDQIYLLDFRRGVMAGYCALWGMLSFWSVFLLIYSHGDLLLCFHILINYFLVISLSFGFWRACFAYCQNLLFYRPRAILIGANQMTNTLINELCCMGNPAPLLLGYVSEQVTDHQLMPSCPYLGGEDALCFLIQHGCVDMLIVATDKPFELIVSQEIVNVTPHALYICSLAELYEVSMGKVALIHMENSWPIMFTFQLLPSLGYRCWRWLLDISFALLGSFLLTLLLPLIATLIHLNSPGPIFYWQERVGYRGRLFRILKFRSMRIDAEQGGASWAMPMDHRVTRVGRVLRALHLDELPQVINILRGEMSLIGPRPERLSFVVLLEQALPLFQYRLAVKPGLTGWAQVKAPYASSLPESATKLQHDLYYVKHQSFTLDVYILFKTVTEIFWCSGR